MHEESNAIKRLSDEKLAECYAIIQEAKYDISSSEYKVIAAAKELCNHIDALDCEIAELKRQLVSEIENYEGSLPRELENSKASTPQEHQWELDLDEMLPAIVTEQGNLGGLVRFSSTYLQGSARFVEFVDNDDSRYRSAHFKFGVMVLVKCKLAETLVIEKVIAIDECGELWVDEDEIGEAICKAYLATYPA